MNNIGYQVAVGGLVLGWVGTHHTLVGLLSRVDPHVDEQLVSGVEGLVAADAAGPEAGEVLSFALVDVHLLDVPHQLLLLLVHSAAIDPAACLLVAKLSPVLPIGSSVGTSVACGLDAL